MIFNNDNPGFSTVTNPTKVIAQRRSKSIGHVWSAKPETLVTSLLVINAAGVFVFSRVNYKDIMISDGPPEAYQAVKRESDINLNG